MSVSLAINITEAEQIIQALQAFRVNIKELEAKILDLKAKQIECINYYPHLQEIIGWDECEELQEMIEGMSGK